MSHANRPKHPPNGGWGGEPHAQGKISAPIKGRPVVRLMAFPIVCQIVCLVIGFALGADLEADEPVETTTGMVGRLNEVKIPGAELEVIPLDDRDTPIVARIVRTFSHGTAFRYDIEFYGLVPGDYDLRDYLRRVDGSSMDLVPSIAVRVTPMLPEGEVRPNQLVVRTPPRLGGYQTTLIILGIAWGAGLLLLVFWRRGGGSAGHDSMQPPTTMAERLRPLIDRAVAGEATQADLANLERGLLTYWRKRLNLQTESTSAAIRELRAHSEAGGLMTQLEAWLHRPDTQQDLDVEALLTPYRDVPEDEWEMQSDSSAARRP